MGNAEESVDVFLKDSDIDKLKSTIQIIKQNVLSIDKEIQTIDQRRNRKGFKYYLGVARKIIIRIDVKSGINFLKLGLWFVMAMVIVYFSSDINSKIISALTYFLGITIDMALLRKHLPVVGYEVMRILTGIAEFVFIVIMAILTLGLMASAMKVTIDPVINGYISGALYICGFVSTFLELVNSIAIDD